MITGVCSLKKANAAKQIENKRKTFEHKTLKRFLNDQYLVRELVQSK